MDSVTVATIKDYTYKMYILLKVMMTAVKTGKDQEKRLKAAKWDLAYYEDVPLELHQNAQQLAKYRTRRDFKSHFQGFVYAEFLLLSDWLWENTPSQPIQEASGTGVIMSNLSQFPSSHPLIKPTRPHPNTNNKYKDWQLSELNAEVAVVGDSNLKRIRASPIPGVQVEAFPGAKFQHITHLIKNYRYSSAPSTLILSVGINHTTDRRLEWSIKGLKMMMLAATRAFPSSKIYLASINAAHGLRGKDHLLAINEMAWQLMSQHMIPPMEDRHVCSSSRRDKVHWSGDTADLLLAHWLSFTS